MYNLYVIKALLISLVSGFCDFYLQYFRQLFRISDPATITLTLKYDVKDITLSILQKILVSAYCLLKSYQQKKFNKINVTFRHRIDKNIELAGRKYVLLFSMYFYLMKFNYFIVFKIIFNV